MDYRKHLFLIQQNISEKSIADLCLVAEFILQKEILIVSEIKNDIGKRFICILLYHFVKS